MRDEIDNILHYGGFSSSKYYTFKRDENGRVRTLHALGARDKVITTLFIDELHRVLSPHFYDNSYSYRYTLPDSEDIFKSYQNQWRLYVGRLSEIVFNDKFKEYHILKVDIKSFYSSINSDKLEVLLNSYIDNSPLDIDRRRTLKLIVSRLVELNRATVGDRGVPQGPAYARYMAELYLSPLDSRIEGYLNLIGDGYCFRYVDDIFIFIPTSGWTLIGQVGNPIYSIGLF